MPSVEFVMKMSVDFCSPDRLMEGIRAGEKVVLLDCRPQNDFVRSHIQGAINISLPNLMLRRLRKGNLKTSCLIQNNEAKETFNRLWKSHKIVIYDECTTDTNSNPSNVVDLLMKKLRQDGANVSCLAGAWRFFSLFIYLLLSFTVWKKVYKIGEVGYAWLISFYFYPSSWVFPLDVYSLIIQPWRRGQSVYCLANTSQITTAHPSLLSTSQTAERPTTPYKLFFNALFLYSP